MHDGSPLYPDDSKSEFEKMRYGHVESTKYINKEIMKSIDTILKQSKTPPIIVLQGDHGIDYTYQENPWCKHQILNSYYLPKEGAKKIVSFYHPGQ